MAARAIILAHTIALRDPRYQTHDNGSSVLVLAACCWMGFRLWLFPTLVACSTTTAVPSDAPPDPPVDALAPARLTLALDRRAEPGPDPILVDIFVARGEVPQLGVAITVEVPADRASAGAAVDIGGGHYLATITPGIASGEIAIRATALGAEARSTAVVLPFVDETWGQPELVPGAVNTPAYEDSSEISPDGQWLLVSSYSPIDLLCCFLAIPQICPTAVTAVDPASPACNVAIGPYAAPLRPDLPGAERITSATTIHDSLPRIGLGSPPGVDLPFAAPPVAAFGFRRQPDGSFAEPFSIAYDADGLPAAPFGITFAQLAGSQATVLYAWNDFRTNGAEDTDNDLFHATFTLGSRVILGTATAGALDREPTRVPFATHVGPAGNPGVAPDGVFFDAEGGDEDLHFVAGDPLGTPPLSAAVTVALSTAAGEYQPFFHAGRLYYARDFQEVRSAARGVGEVSLAATWTEDRVELGLDGTTELGRVLAIGEPSLTADELYFVYGTRTSQGLDQNIARVRRR